MTDHLIYDLITGQVTGLMWERLQTLRRIARMYQSSLWNVYLELISIDYCVRSDPIPTEHRIPYVWTSS